MYALFSTFFFDRCYYVRKLLYHKHAHDHQIPGKGVHEIIVFNLACSSTAIDRNEYNMIGLINTRPYSRFIDNLLSINLGLYYQLSSDLEITSY